jgi:hypothetical protein
MRCPKQLTLNPKWKPHRSEVQLSWKRQPKYCKKREAPLTCASTPLKEMDTLMLQQNVQQE